MAFDAPALRLDRLTILINELYGAAGSDVGWRTFLEKLCTELGDPSARVISRDFLLGSTEIVEAARTSPESRCADNGNCYVEDRAQGAMPGPPQPSRGWTGDCEPFGSSNKVMLEALLPHLRTAFQLRRRLANATVMATTFVSAFDRLRCGILLTTATGRVGHVNRAARAVFEARDGLTLESGELRAARARDTTAIREAIRSASMVGEEAHSSNRLSIRRPSGRVAYVVGVGPSVRPSVDLFLPAPMAVTIVITDPARCATTSPAHVTAALGVTLAEARVGLQLLAGASTIGIASALQISPSTVRTHLRHLFLKTGTARQADLVRVLTTIVPPWVD